ncbi:ectin isoform X3 [Pocillopora verrucosa]|uniref:ectin isoform X3 n=1 Tax=Pocillopora verrucosa TaxID=203993 RepID=UPI003342BF4F
MASLKMLMTLSMILVMSFQLNRAVPLSNIKGEFAHDFPEDFNSFADSAECKDERDCSWIPNELAKRPGENLDEYCSRHKNTPAVKQCRKTCKFCKAPAPVECKDERDCSWIPKELAKRPGETLDEYCSMHKNTPAIKQCRDTCKFCKEPSPAGEEPSPAECKDERDCSWIPNELAKRPGETLDEYCSKHKNTPAVKQCRNTCKFCKAPSPAVCEDERTDCYALVVKTGGGQALENYCNQWKAENAIQQCRRTCNLCSKPPSPPIEPETMAPQTEQPTPETAEPSGSKPPSPPIEPETMAPQTEQPTPETAEPSGFQKDCLEVHNCYRGFHNAPPLRWSAELTRAAQEWADYLASRDEFVHDPTLRAKGQGENLYYKSPSKRLCNYGEFGPECLSCGEIVTRWYDEEIDYDYATGETKTPSAPISHFTRIVWKATREVGMATAVGHGKLIAVARYSPAGNTKGLFQENVHPPPEEILEAPQRICLPKIVT